MKEIELILGLKETVVDITSTELTKHSSLAQSLVTIYDAASNQETCPIKINGSISLFLQTNFKILEHLTMATPSANQTSTHHKNLPTMRPYNALLLLQDPEEIIANFPLDVSPLLLELVQIVTPTQWYPNFNV